MILVPKTLCQFRSQPEGIREDKPILPALVVLVFPAFDQPPYWLVKPVFHVLFFGRLCGQKDGCGLRFRRINPVALALKRIGGKRYAPARLMSVETLPVNALSQQP